VPVHCGIIAVGVLPLDDGTGSFGMAPLPFMPLPALHHAGLLYAHLPYRALPPYGYLYLGRFAGLDLVTPHYGYTCYRARTARRYYRYCIHCRVTAVALCEPLAACHLGCCVDAAGDSATPARRDWRVRMTYGSAVT